MKLVDDGVRQWIELDDRERETSDAQFLRDVAEAAAHLRGRQLRWPFGVLEDLNNQRWQAELQTRTMHSTTRSDPGALYAFCVMLAAHVVRAARLANFIRNGGADNRVDHTRR